MSIGPGTRIGSYDITAAIGAGGMGEVFRARATSLGRDVAITVLSASVADDPERLARVEREAKLLASLSHTNIAQVYGLERSPHGSGPAAVAAVYLARDLRHDRPVAHKLLHAEIAAAVGHDRFNQEIRLAARLQHPHILGVFDSGETDDPIFAPLRGNPRFDKLIK